LLTSDIDDRDKKFVTGERTSEGFYVVKTGGAGDRQRFILCPLCRPDLDGNFKPGS
jgi:hypothetical protein